MICSFILKFCCIRPKTGSSSALQLKTSVSTDFSGFKAHSICVLVLFGTLPASL